MERGIWRPIRRTARALGRRRPSRRHTYTDAGILEVYLWAALHDRPVCWACDPSHWPPGSRRGPLPSPATVSRRMRQQRMPRLLERLRCALDPRGAAGVIAVIDGMPMPIGPHSHDRQSGYGRAASGKARGYKLHAIVASSSRVIAWRVAPMNIDERTMARRMLRELEHAGYLLADGNSDSNRVFDAAMARGVQLVTPRRYGSSRGLGHHRHSPARLRSKDLLEHDPTGFGRSLMRQRWGIERFFGTLSSLPGGLSCLPAWVRTWRRVRNWVAAKLVIDAARAAVRKQALV